jgi:hypothetical protein
MTSRASSPLGALRALSPFGRSRSPAREAMQEDSASRNAQRPKSPLQTLRSLSPFGRARSPPRHFESPQDSAPQSPPAKLPESPLNALRSRSPFVRSRSASSSTASSLDLLVLAATQEGSSPQSASSQRKPSTLQTLRSLSPFNHGCSLAREATPEAHRREVTPEAHRREAALESNQPPHQNAKGSRSPLQILRSRSPFNRGCSPAREATPEAYRRPESGDSTSQSPSAQRKLSAMQNLRNRSPFNRGRSLSPVGCSHSPAHAATPEAHRPEVSKENSAPQIPNSKRAKSPLQKALRRISPFGRSHSPVRAAPPESDDGDAQSPNPQRKPSLLQILRNLSPSGRGRSASSPLTPPEAMPHLATVAEAGVESR